MDNTTRPAHVDRVRDAYLAIGQADTDKLFALYAADAVVRHGGKGPFAGAHVGLDDIKATMARSMELSEGTFREFAPHIVVGDDQFVYSAARATARRPDGRELDTIVAAVFRFERDYIVEVFQHVADQNAWDAFWA